MKAIIEALNGLAVAKDDKSKLEDIVKQMSNLSLLVITSVESGVAEVTFSTEGASIPYRYAFRDADVDVAWVDNPDEMPQSMTDLVSTGTHIEMCKALIEDSE